MVNESWPTENGKAICKTSVKTINSHHWLMPPPPHKHTIIYMRKNKRRNVLTHARVNFSQSETNSLLRGEGGLHFELLLWGGLREKIHACFCTILIHKLTFWQVPFTLWRIFVHPKLEFKRRCFFLTHIAFGKI